MVEDKEEDETCLNSDKDVIKIHYGKGPVNSPEEEMAFQWYNNQLDTLFHNLKEEITYPDVQTSKDIQDIQEVEVDDIFDMRLYSENGYFPKYISNNLENIEENNMEENNIEENMEENMEENVEQEEDEEEEEMLKEWKRKKTPGKWGTYYWENEKVRPKK